MAKAKVEVVIPPVAALREVTLVLSELEARTLVEILAHIGGDPVKTARRHAASIYEALLDAGFEPVYEEEHLMKYRKVGDSHGLYFVADLPGEVR